MTTLDGLEPATEPVIHALRINGELRLVLQVTEVAKLLGISRAVVYSLVRSGQLRIRNPHPGSRNSRYLIPVSALVEYLQGRDEPIPSTI